MCPSRASLAVPQLSPHVLELNAALSSRQLSQSSFCTSVKVIKEAAPDTSTDRPVYPRSLASRQTHPSFIPCDPNFGAVIGRKSTWGYTKTHLPSWPMILNSLSGLREKEAKSKLSSLTQPPLCHLPSLFNSLPLIPSALNSNL